MEFEYENTYEIDGEIDGEMKTVASYTLEKPRIENNALIAPIKIESLATNKTTFNINTNIDLDYLKKLIKDYEESL